MSTSHQLMESVIVMLSLISLAALLRKINLLKKSDSTLTSKLVLKVTLPAIISHLLLHKSSMVIYLL